jgi:hypothetical protein
LPRVHIGKVVYGTSELDPLTDRWIYRGTSLFAAYDTKQSFLDSYPHGVHSMLPGWHIKGRYAVPHNWRYAVRVTKIMWKRFKAPFALFAGIVGGAVIASTIAYAAISKEPHVEPVSAESKPVDPASASS